MATREVKSYSGTRQKIVELLRGGSHTVEEISREIGITDNAVRAQVSVLERDGLVQAVGEKKSARRPAVMYGLGPSADRNLSRAYPDVLSHLMRVLAEGLPEREFKAVMKKLGKVMAAEYKRPLGTIRERVEGAVKVYETLGAQGTVSEEGGTLVISGHGCPLSEAVKADHRMCGAVEAFLSELVGSKVVERCDRSGRPKCRFEVPLSGK